MLTFALLVCLSAACLAFPQKPEGTTTEPVTAASAASGTKCGYSTCGKNAMCDQSDGYQKCVCKKGFYGSPYGAESECTTEPECVDDSACNEDKFCNDYNLCENPCIYKCADVGCKVRKHVAECIYDGHLFWQPYEQTAPPSTEGSTS